jgi:GntR family transcriptional regulator, transcriptional repressor for pyruvate dehydrogenase complex
VRNYSLRENGMAKRKSLTSIVADALTDDILSGRLKLGEQIKTEAELCEYYEVSRTVVREAIARLRSDGLLIAHQGRGVFVSEQPILPKFEISEDDLSSLPETISMLELRMGVEIESAGLCAERATDKQIGTIRTLMEQVDSELKDPNAIRIHYDYEFHLAIAMATGNPVFHRFLKFLEPIIVPRYRLGSIVDVDFKDQYYDLIHAEHLAIVEAIEARNPDAARVNMRLHLLSSLERIRTLASEKGIPFSMSENAGPKAELLGNLGDAISTSPEV